MNKQGVKFGNITFLENRIKMFLISYSTPRFCFILKQFWDGAAFYLTVYRQRGFEIARL